MSTNMVRDSVDPKLGFWADEDIQTPLYIAEIAPPAIRGRLIGFYELCWQLGGLVGFWINFVGVS